MPDWCVMIMSGQCVMRSDQCAMMSDQCVTMSDQCVVSDGTGVWVDQREAAAGAG